MKNIYLLNIVLAVICLASIEAMAEPLNNGIVLVGNINEVPNSTCMSRNHAENEARNLALKVAQTYCRKEGYGWKSSSIKEYGNLECNSCGGERVTCRYSDVSLECRKPESKLTWLSWLAGKP